MILPTVKQQTHSGLHCALPKQITCSHDSTPAAALGARAFANLYPSAVPQEGMAYVRFVLDLSLEDRPEIYRVTVTEHGIAVSFRDERGAVNGAATVALLLCDGAPETGEILDYPTYAYRSVMIDMARGLPAEAEVENAIRYMALGKINRLHLHLTDDKGPCYRSEAVPEYAFLGKGGQCDIAYLRRLADLCASYAIEIIPEIEIPAHADALCEAHPEFKCEVENAEGWALCPGNEEVWRFYEALVGEIAAIFPHSEYIHIGTDELEFLDLHPPRICHWEECPRCAALRQRKGLADKREEFYYVVERMHDIVRAHGKKMMMWNDQIDISHPVSVSRDILIQFWRIAGRGRGPHEGCTMNKFLEQGFRVVNAYYPCTYFDLESYLSAEKMKTWTPHTVPEQSEAYADQVLGGEACAWEFGNEAEYPFYSYVTAPVIAVFADKLWSGEDREQDTEYKTALSVFLFGTAEMTDVFDLVGGIIPPRRAAQFTYNDPATLSREHLRTCLHRLERIDGHPAATAFANLLYKIDAQIS